MIFRRIDARTVVFLADDQETEILRVTLPEGGVTSAEILEFSSHLFREARKREDGPT